MAASPPLDAHGWAWTLARPQRGEIFLFFFLSLIRRLRISSSVTFSLIRPFGAPSPRGKVLVQGIPKTFSWGPRRSPAQRVRWGEEEHGSGGRATRGSPKKSGLCDDVGRWIARRARRKRKTKSELCDDVRQKWDKSGTNLGQKWDKNGTKMGQIWDKNGTKVGQKWDEFYRLLCYTGSVKAPGRGALPGERAGAAVRQRGEVRQRGAWRKPHPSCPSGRPAANPTSFLKKENGSPNRSIFGAKMGEIAPE